jgi:hypothetical protein
MHPTGGAQFAERRELLEARAALLAVQRVLRADRVRLESPTWLSG